MLRLTTFIFIAIWQIKTCFSQTVIKGIVKDKVSKLPLANVVIAQKGISAFSVSDSLGQFQINIKPQQNFEVYFQLIGYTQQKISINEKNANLNLEIYLEPDVRSLKELNIEDKAQRRTTMQSLDPRLVTLMPSIGGVETLLKTLPGVVSNNELSSQYSVRGGSFDENLIYVNDVEVYRPFLVRSGQQEGLSFINPDLVENINFSAGGFEARYGDKMSSVLDITYRRPKKAGGSFTATLLGGSMHLEGASKDTRFTYLMGIRQRSNRYILRTLDTQGDYRPNFIDGQALFTYDLTTEWQLSFLGNYARNKYNFIPETRESRFGTVTSVKQINVFFQGQEINDYETYLGAFTASYSPNKTTKLKFITSSFRSFETEKANVLGEYLIYDVEADFAKENFGDTTNLTGVGAFLNHSRNFLDARVFNIEHRGVSEDIRWGIKFQRELISDRLSEWIYIDSSGYALPYSETEINLQDVIKQNISLESSRVMGFFQKETEWGNKTEQALVAGVRFNYWTLNRQFFIAPRINYSIKPDWENDWLFRISSGIYNQPPFYRELRNFSGELNTGIRAQNSIHFVLGADCRFKVWDLPMKFTAETYYKHLTNLIPYKIENVRLRYFAENNSVGYARGIDLKLHGDFVKGAESWISFSVMETKEDIIGDSYQKFYNANGEQIFPGFGSDTVSFSRTIDVGYIPRPTDQRVNVGFFYQDYIPKFPTFKVNISLFFGTGMPFGPNGLNKYADTLRIPPYRRVDIGFSKQLIKPNSDKHKKYPVIGYIKDAWISLEVFNLLQIKNTISYLWVKDTNGIQYAIPNYLTNRQFNLKFYCRF